MDATPWLIVGLGNPGARYARTRHNVGFMALAAFAAAQWPAHLGAPRWTEKWKGLTATLSCGAQRCVLLQPQTFMNRSGASVVPAAQFHRVPPPQIVVVHDEIDFPLGRLAIKKGGGHGGHNGLRDIVAQLGSADFLRVRLGVGRPVHGEVADYVLSDFRPDEEGPAADLVERAAKALTCMMTDGVVMAMNKFNTLPDRANEPVSLADSLALPPQESSPPVDIPIQTLLYAVPACGGLALLYALFTASWIAKQDPGTVRMQKIAEQIFRGAMAFLAAEYKVLAIFVVIIGGILALSADASSSPLVGLSFVAGAMCSALAGFFGMRVATRANVRTAAAARVGLSPALSIAFRGGAVMGMCVVGLGLVGFGSLFIAYLGQFDALADVDGQAVEFNRVVNMLAGFAMGASSIALFARVGGGIYTKAADVGADLVGKVEAGIPEDHFLNPATIADNVGDNVGDVAGMGADLFESYIGAILGTMVLGAVAVSGRLEAAILPLLIAAAGIVMSILGTFFVRTKEGGNPQIALDTGSFGAAFIMLPISWGIIYFCVMSAAGHGTPMITTDLSGLAACSTNGAMDMSLVASEACSVAQTWALFWAIVAGLVSGVAIGAITGFYCSKGKRPVNSIVEQSSTGPATNIIAGIGVGFESTAIPILLIAGAIFVANYFAGLYGVALAALGMLSTTGIQLAVDAYGPISDNAGGIAEMSGLPHEVRERTDNLDAVGNTTAAIGKGFAIASAALAALSLFAAYRNIALKGSDLLLTDPKVLIGLLIGGMLPFLFSAMAMKAVGAAAMDMITEVRRQFREIPVLRAALLLVAKAEKENRDLTPDEEREVLAAGEKTEVERCVAISTKASIRRMVMPGVLALVSPVIVGFWSRNALGGLLAGTLVTGVMLAIFMSNAGGAWDNAKKQVEDQKKDSSQAVNTGKGSERHKAAVIGDTVGDPFKDTAGPSLNILIKLMTIVAVVIAPILVKYGGL